MHRMEPMQAKERRPQLRGRGAVYGGDGVAVIALLRAEPWPEYALQLIGDGLIAAFGRHVQDATAFRECVQAAAERGDDELADQLDALLGTGPPRLQCHDVRPRGDADDPDVAMPTREADHGGVGEVGHVVGDSALHGDGRGISEGFGAAGRCGGSVTVEVLVVHDRRATGRTGKPGIGGLMPVRDVADRDATAVDANGRCRFRRRIMGPCIDGGQRLRFEGWLRLVSRAGRAGPPRGSVCSSYLVPGLRQPCRMPTSLFASWRRAPGS